MISAIAIVLTLSTPAPTAPHPLVGTWKVTYPWHLEVVNGVLKPTMENGELKVETRGDSLIAMLVTNPTPAEPRRKPLRLTAPLGAAETVFVTRSVVTLTVGGTQRNATAVTTWLFNVAGDQLSGSVERRIDGIDAKTHGPQPLTGSRSGT